MKLGTEPFGAAQQTMTSKRTHPTSGSIGRLKGRVELVIPGRIGHVCGQTT